MFVLPQPFPPHPFMQNPSNGFPPPFGRAQPRFGLYEPLKPRRRRKRKLAETDIDGVNPLNDRTATLSLANPAKQNNDDAESASLLFMKQSTKRKRTNQMEHSRDQIVVDAMLERNIYTHSPGEPPQSAHSSPISGTKAMGDAVDGDDRSGTPYLHPYHLATESLSPPNRAKSNEATAGEPQLSAFRMDNSDNERVSEWRHSIESQLESVRTQTPSQIEELCHRISNTAGLGRQVLMAKLRKQLPADTFRRVCQAMKIEPR